MPPTLRLYEDILASNAPDLQLPALPRMIFVVHGAVAVEGRSFGDGEAWHGEGAATLRPGRGGVACWRFELAAAGAADGGIESLGATSRPKLAASLDPLPKGDLLLRGDSVAFPPGGCA